MPHIKIEVTSNLLATVDPEKLMIDVANRLNSLGCFKADDIKVRIYPIEYSSLGIVSQEHSYVATEIQVLNNKPDSLLLDINNLIHNTILSYFDKTIGKSSITTKVTEINKNHYNRTSNYS